MLNYIVNLDLTADVKVQVPDDIAKSNNLWDYIKDICNHQINHGDFEQPEIHVNGYSLVKNQNPLQKAMLVLKNTPSRCDECPFIQETESSDDGYPFTCNAVSFSELEKTRGPRIPDSCLNGVKLPDWCPLEPVDMPDEE